MRRLATGRSHRWSTARSLALRPRLATGLPCLQTDRVTAIWLPTPGPYPPGGRYPNGPKVPFGALLHSPFGDCLSRGPCAAGRQAAGLPRAETPASSVVDGRDQGIAGLGSAKSRSSSSAGSGRAR